MTEAVLVGALAVAGLNAIAGLIGALSWYSSGSREGALRRVFWVALRVGQAGALLYGLAIGVLTAAGSYSSDRLFYLYALLPLVIAFVAEQLRLASAQTILDRHDLDNAQAVGELPESRQQAIVMAILRREMGVMALSAVVVVFLALRAAGTAKF